jgi:streptomycin 6-kinase
MSAPLPEKFLKTIVCGFGDKGRARLNDLPRIIDELSDFWEIKVGRAFPNLSYHFVAPCARADGTPVVLKIGFPGEAETTFNEIRMLRFLDGKFAVRLVSANEARFALLLERVLPGDNLKLAFAAAPESAASAAARLGQMLWRPAPLGHGFPSLETWFASLGDSKDTGFPQDCARSALGFFEDLNRTDSRTLLHGDFHHENILTGTRCSFLAIDPKGIIGSPGYDAAVFLINHARWLESRAGRQRHVQSAIEIFARALQMRSRDIRQWVYSSCVLSAWWSYQENAENWRDQLAFADFWL